MAKLLGKILNSIQNHHAKTNKSSLFLAAVLIFVALVTSNCAYRLTNLHAQAPNKIQTIAIESIYDTSGEVIPHEQLWNELQRAFAANGHLKLTSATKADALLRAHLRSATSVKAGDRTTVKDKPKKDISLYGEAGPPISPSALRDLSIANDYFTKDRQSMTIDVEIWDLKTRNLLLQRTYTGGFEVLSVRPNAEIPPQLSMVRHEESNQYGVAKIAKQIAETVVSDLLVR